MRGGSYWSVTNFVKDQAVNWSCSNTVLDRCRQKDISSVIVARLQDNGRMIRLRDVVREMKMDHDI